MYKSEVNLRSITNQYLKEMKRAKINFLLIIMLISSIQLLTAQTPNTHDCMGAVPLCDTVFHQSSTISNVGNIPNEINVAANQCLINELGGVWYRFVPTTTGVLRFSIIPDNPAGEDFDWVLFDLTNKLCDSLSQGNPFNYMISANTAGAASTTPPLINQGPTGINSDSSIVGSNICIGPGAGDGLGIGPLDWNNFNPDVTIVAGNVYYLYVAQFSGSQGYTIDFSQSIASIINNLDASITPVDSMCNLGNPINLTAVDTGGIWSGVGVVDTINGIFSPQISGVGTFNISYKIRGNCPVADTLEIRVITNPIPVFSYYLEQSFCDGTNLYLENNSTNSSHYSWYHNNILIDSTVNSQVIGLEGTQNEIILEASNNVCKDSSTQLISNPEIDQQILTPNVFTPNGDGLNDFFQLPNNIMECIIEFKIFNRWGVEIYNDTNAQGWNGKNKNNKLLSTGTYYYIIKVKGSEFKGAVLLL